MDVDLPEGPMIIEVNIGRNYLDGTWHVIWLDLQEVVAKAFSDYEGTFGNLRQSDWEIVKADHIKIRGRMFRLDDIIFRKEDFTRIDQPDMFEPGPLYAQLFEPCRYLFMSDYEAQGDVLMLSDFLLEPDNFVTDPNRIRDIWIADAQVDKVYPLVQSFLLHFINRREQIGRQVFHSRGQFNRNSFLQYILP